MVDFINEVEEELRKDQYNVLLRKWGPLIAAVAIGIVAVAGVYEYIKTSDARAAKNASISYVAASNTLESGECCHVQIKLPQKFKFLFWSFEVILIDLFVLS